MIVGWSTGDGVEVTASEGKALADRIGAMFVELSADRAAVERAMVELMKRVITHKSD
jgi:hypothetical protein